ncbi:MAG: hypothetical protein M3140_09005 [Actinomycetota bacterium]|nr:hypothetical protein [Actinomycetota bacterium]
MLRPNTATELPETVTGAFTGADTIERRCPVVSVGAEPAAWLRAEVGRPWPRTLIEFPEIVTGRLIGAAMIEWCVVGCWWAVSAAAMPALSAHRPPAQAVICSPRLIQMFIVSLISD